jgi:DNA-binding SARP family transcriptional activator
MDRIGQRLIETGRCYDELQVGLGATSTEPLRESAHRLLVRVHLMQGNVAEAIRQYRLCVELLSDEMNGRPSPGIGILLPRSCRESRP